MSSAVIENWQSQIKAAAAKGAKLTIRGSASKSFCSPAISGEFIVAREHAGIVEYEPNELVIVVRCGTRIADVEKTMADAGQMLAFEPPHFGEGATIGEWSPAVFQGRVVRTPVHCATSYSAAKCWMARAIT